MSDNTLLGVALDVYDRGFTPIPQRKDKSPLIPWGHWVENKPKRSMLRYWFANPCNLAIISGKGSGICVLDIDDPSKFPFEMPITPTVKTTRGYHLYFKYPENVQIRNTNLPYGDFKADRSLVTMPPSVHASGKKYEWIYNLNVPFADMPGWLLDAVRRRIDYNKGDPVEIEWSGSQETTPYAKPWFGDVEELANTQEGGRNNLLNIISAKAGNLIAGGQLNEVEAREALIGACKQNGLWSEEERNTLATIESGLKKGFETPRVPTAKQPANDNWTDNGELKFKRLKDIEIESIDWVWEGVLARGAVSIIGGEQGIGKSTITLNIAATISNGSMWPVGDKRAKQGNVIIVSCEDSPEYTTGPRLTAAKADPSRSLILEEAGFRLDKDIPRLRRLIESMGDVELVVIDPVGAHLGKADNNSLGDVRGITTQLAELAKECNLSVLLVLHLNKNTKATNVLDRFAGSGAWTQAARTVFLVDADQDERERLTMSVAKTNLPGNSQTYHCMIKPASLRAGNDTIETSYIEWEHYTEKKHANQVLAERGGKLSDAMAEIEDILQYGPVDRMEFDKRTSHISPATKKRAKEKLGVWYDQKGKDTGKYILGRVAQAA